MFHSDYIVSMAQVLQPKVYVELGVGYAGVSTLNRVHAVLTSLSTVYGIDIVDLSHKLVKTNNLHFHNCTTDEFFAKWGGDPMDMIFIDADHDADAVYKDASNYYQFLTKDTGIMFLHDTWPVDEGWTGPDKSGTAYKAVKRLKDSLVGAEVLTIPSPHGLTLIRKVGNDWRNGLN